MRDPEALREYAQRDWAKAKRATELFWIERKRLLGPAEGIRMGDELRRHAKLVRPDWPSQAERDDDAATHLRVIDALRRVPPRRL